MFKALLGGGRSSSDVRSSSSSKSSSRRRTDSKSSTVSRKSSRGDDRDRGLGDLSTYRSSSSRSKRYAPSLAGESVASSYATADQGPVEPDRYVIERAPRRQDSDDTIRGDRYRDNGDEEGKTSRRRERVRSPSRERERTRTDRNDRAGDTISRDRDGDRPERKRTQSGDMYSPPVSVVTNGTPTTSLPSPPHATAFYDPHIPQQFPGQFPTYVAEPYRPPHPAGEAAEYYGDQGQSVQDQPGVRPKPPLVTPSDQAHLMAASPVANPPPEPSSMGQVGAAAAYYTDDADLGIEQAEQPSSASASKPPKPAKPSKPKPPRPSVQTAAISGSPAAAVATTAAAAAATELSEHTISESPSTYVPPSASSPQKPPHSQGVGAAVGAAAVGAAAGYMMSHHHQSSVSVDHSYQETVQNHEEVSQNSPAYPDPSMYPPQQTPTSFAAGPAAAAAAAAAGYAASPLHPHHAAVYHGAPFQSGGLAFQQRQRGPLDKFIDFWRDPEGVGMFEDYTETIGICQYCFEPGSTSRDAPRRHNHKPRRRSADRYTNGSRVDKTSRYTSSEDEGRRRKRSPSNSWLPGLLGGIAVKSIFSNKEFDESYSIRSGRVASSRHSIHESEGASTAGRQSQTSRGVYRRSYRSQSRERTDHSFYHSDSKLSKYEDSRVRSRSRSRSSSRVQRHAALRDAALGAAVGTAAMSEYESRHRSRSRSPSPRKARGRKTSSSDSSFVDISRPARKTVGSGFSSFFTASSENRRKRRTKRRKSIFSFHNSSSSSLDADLAFGNGYTKRQSGKSNRKGKKKADEDVDAALLGLSATATALVASSERSRRRTGEILAGKESRSGRSYCESSAANDDGWEDLDSGDQSSSSVNSGLAFGGSGLFPSTDSHSSDSGTSRWTWGWGRKKTKKKRRSRSPGKRFPAEAAIAAGLGTAALASAYHRDSKASGQDAASSTGSLQHVAPIPTSDPSRFDAINVSSLPPAQPTLVRPGPIPLQQPQPVTRVSQSVYTTQGESIHAYSAPDEPPTPGSAFMPYETPLPHARSDRWNQRSEEYVERSDISSRINRSHRRSDSSPVIHTEPLESMSTTSVRRRATLKDQASVQFDLTEEQANKERRSNQRESSRRDGERREGVQLVDREQEMAVRNAEHQASRQREREYEKSRMEEEYSRRERDSSSWIGAAAAGAVGVAAVGTMLSGKSSNDDSSETASQRRHEERREKRRAERRRVSESESIASSLPMSEAGKPVAEERSQVVRQPEDVRPQPSRRPPRTKPAKPVYEDYARFFAPEELRYSPDTYARREPTSMPTIIEVEPTNEASIVTEEPHPDYTGLPWPVPGLTLTEPTPPQSLIGSARASPIILIPERPKEDVTFERQTTGSRVSWGKHEMHEYEVPSTSSELESVDQDTRGIEHGDVEHITARDVQEYPAGSSTDPSPKDVPSIVGADIEFAAALAAATAAAGFDPSLVTDDPTYHTRSSPMSKSKVEFVSPWDEMPVSRTVPHGFVEGEVETPDNERAPVTLDHRIEDSPLFAEPEPLSGGEIITPAPQSIAQAVIEHLNRPKGRDANDRFDSQRSLESVSKSEQIEPPEEVLSMPGGFEPEELFETPKEPSDPTTTQGDRSFSVVSAPEARDDMVSTTQDNSDQSGSDFEGNDEISASAVGSEAVEGKKKRRKRRSKRKSDNSEEAVSSTSSPARSGEASDKRRSTDEKSKETRSGGYLSNLFGSRISEPVEVQRASSSDRRSSREVQSEVGPRRREKSSRRRSSNRGDALDDETSAVEDKENINVEHYKSSRQRREERRRQRYEDMMDSGKPSEYEKV
ncbi:involucrin repeat protein [Aspergillus ibericus CBS 121593]|uniref:Involucrin repeat protein n=1 Tax=Aspergillus ibericus CBS 121593 TaxID=1448316 RepID=A0A395GMA1_9EURO|nr:hypothetical protein BO80DRAFT_419659 [Aspergillus ibericus CBS 121593]RAK95143.1 hypothetical protein BO80DRAFT_419659 [Aspergillus ibericus CBS 121593]